MVRRLLIFAWAVTAIALNVIASEPIRVQRQMECAGIIRAIEPGWLTVEDARGRRARFQMQSQDSVGLLLQRGSVVVRYPCAVHVRAETLAQSLPVGTQIACVAKIHLATRRCQAPLSQVKLIESTDLNMRWSSTLRSECVLTAEVVSVTDDAMHVKTADDGEELQLRLPLAQGAVAVLRSDNARWLRPGDLIESLTAVRFHTGEWVAKDLRVKVNNFVGRSPTARLQSFPAPMVARRQVRSAHFLLLTDLPDGRVQRLLASLERIWSKLERHFGAAPRGLIRCYVLGDLNQWDAASFDATAWAKIKQGAGVTVTERQRDQVCATVYACADEKVVRHEVVHAFCAETFGDTGPTWYAEGLAEWGSYEELRLEIQPSRASRGAVVVDPVVADYLRSQSARSLDSVVAEHQGTGDSWQAYAWRWAACQTLMANPNYSSRFAEYGRTLMTGGKRISLDGFWGLDSHRARFEFQQFVRHVGVGYDPALCAWNWEVPFHELHSGQRIRTTVQARRGWQPSAVRVLKDAAYDFVGDGTWRVDDYRAALSADGAAHGEGKLSAVILDDQLKLHRPFALGRSGSFRCPATGRLYLRCLDSWTQLGDNSGTLTVHLRRR